MSKEKLDALYWNNRYLNQNTAWDIGSVSTPIKEYIDKIEDKNLTILIPGAGNAYEAAYLVSKGFTNIHVLDIAPTLVENLKHKFAENPQVSLHCQDFFMHQGNYDLILEQTFFCALNPSLRLNYIDKMHELLKVQAKLVGVLFDTEFEREGPPFGGRIDEYYALFSDKFNILLLEKCRNSILPRAGKEAFIMAEKTG
jgi:SAM-dependent methyltransferase